MFDYMYDETNFYGIVDEMLEIYDDNDLRLIENDWFNKLKLDNYNLLKYTFFGDIDFLRNFIHVIPMEEQINYVQNTINYGLGIPYDSRYVLVAKRAIPSSEPKLENFWSTEYNEPLYGLNNEIRDEQRLHSVIMVSTLEKLECHGFSMTMGRGGSDGEIVINPNKAFNDFLFMYKPRTEFYKLIDFLEKGGIGREDLLSKLRANAYDRAVAQGLQVNNYEEIESGRMK